MLHSEQKFVIYSESKTSLYREYPWVPWESRAWEWRVLFYLRGNEKENGNGLVEWEWL